jgi:hypothetical protein
MDIHGRKRLPIQQTPAAKIMTAITIVKTFRDSDALDAMTPGTTIQIITAIIATKEIPMAA